MIWKSTLIYFVHPPPLRKYLPILSILTRIWTHLLFQVHRCKEGSCLCLPYSATKPHKATITSIKPLIVLISFIRNVGDFMRDPYILAANLIQQTSQCVNYLYFVVVFVIDQGMFFDRYWQRDGFIIILNFVVHAFWVSFS